MNKRSTVSVLMSVYKKETGAHLDRSLNSIWTEQIRKPDVIVLVEDGPLTVELYDVIDKWQRVLDDKLVRPKNDVNKGLTEALNLGLNYVTTDFVARMDSDDRSAPERFLLQVGFLEAHPDIDVVGGTLVEFDSTNPSISERHYPTENIKGYICKASPIAHPASMMRMKVFREGGLRYDPNYPMNEDIALWYDMLRKGYQLSNIDDVVYYFNCDGGMFERRSKEKAWSEFKVYMRGIKDLYGLFTYRYIYPILRYIFRLMPISVISKIYGSSVRKKFLTNNKYRQCSVTRVYDLHN